MAGAQRPPGDRVNELEAPEAIANALQRAATERGFFAVVAWLERLTVGAPRVGENGPYAREQLRFRHDPALTFSTADISGVHTERGRENPVDPLSAPVDRFVVMTTFLGLTGAVTPLPPYLAEEVALEDPDAPRRRDFLDVFHHRVISLLYRLVARCDLAGEFRNDASDAWSKRLLAIGGAAGPEVPPTTLETHHLLRLSPLLSRRARTARGLELALADVLGQALGEAGVAVEQFVGTWAMIDLPERMRLGVCNHSLGKSTVLGERMFDRAGKFRVVLGPFSDQRYRRFLADGDQLPRLREVVELFCRDPLELDLELTLMAGAAPVFRLGGEGTGARLGHDTWLRDRPGETRIVVEIPWRRGETHAS